MPQCLISYVFVHYGLIEGDTMVWSGLVWSGMVCLVYLRPGVFAFFSETEREGETERRGTAKMVKRRRQEGKDGEKSRGKQARERRDAMSVRVCYVIVPYHHTHAHTRSGSPYSMHGV
jgi:hypothetical protein